MMPSRLLCPGGNWRLWCPLVLVLDMTLWDVEVTLICPSKIGSEGRLNSPTAFGIHAGMTCNVCGTHVGGSLECFLGNDTWWYWIWHVDGQWVSWLSVWPNCEVQAPTNPADANSVLPRSLGESGCRWQFCTKLHARVPAPGRGSWQSTFSKWKLMVLLQWTRKRVEFHYNRP